MMAEPPSEPTFHATVAELLPATAVPIVMVDGTVYGVTRFDRADGCPVPPLFVAATVKE